MYFTQTISVFFFLINNNFFLISNFYKWKQNIHTTVFLNVLLYLQVFWEITGPFDDTADFQPKNGSVYLGDLQRDASFNIQILPDTLPELTETFKVILTSVEGGAEIDTSNNEAVFHIRYGILKLFCYFVYYNSLFSEPLWSE